jgi:hypothetical protein
MESRGKDLGRSKKALPDGRVGHESSEVKKNLAAMAMT